MKYGNISAGAPDYTDDIAALKDLLEKGEIDSKEYSRRMEGFRRARLTYIVATNGGYSPKKVSLKKQEQITEYRDRVMAERTKEFAEQIEGTDEATS